MSIYLLEHLKYSKTTPKEKLKSFVVNCIFVVFISDYTLIIISSTSNNLMLLQILTLTSNLSKHLQLKWLQNERFTFSVVYGMNSVWITVRNWFPSRCSSKLLKADLLWSDRCHKLLKYFFSLMSSHTRPTLTNNLKCCLGKIMLRFFGKVGFRFSIVALIKPFKNTMSLTQMCPFNHLSHF